VWVCVFAIHLLMAPVGSQEVAVDGIVAVVNEEVITLTDFRIVHEFGIHRLDQENEPALSSRRILDGLIEQKLIILITNADINVRVVELERLYQQLSDSLGTELFQQKMAEFDLTREELYVYIREMSASRLMLAQRFQRTVSVTLREIEEYYEQTYVPEQRDKGQEPQPMVEILDMLEAEVKSEETNFLSEEWVRNLMKEADIRVFAEHYPQYFDKIQNKGPENGWQN
jgi:hypothetical protein